MRDGAAKFFVPLVPRWPIAVEAAPWMAMVATMVMAVVMRLEGLPFPTFQAAAMAGPMLDEVYRRVRTMIA